MKFVLCNKHNRPYDADKYGGCWQCPAVKYCEKCGGTVYKSRRSYGIDENGSCPQCPVIEPCEQCGTDVKVKYSIRNTYYQDDFGQMYDEQEFLKDFYCCKCGNHPTIEKR